MTTGSRHLAPGSLLFALLLPFVAAVALGAASPGQFEPHPQLAPGDVLPAENIKTANYEVLAPVDNDGFMNTFHVSSPFGKLDVEGGVLLRIRLKELDAMAELASLSKSKVFTDAVAEGVKNATLGQVETVAAFAQRPVETVKGIPSGVSRMFKSYKGQAKEAYSGYKEDKAADAASGEEKGTTDKVKETSSKAVDAGQVYAKKYLGTSKAERRWAQKLGVDPYTTNVQLQEMLAAVAKVDAAGRFGVRFVGIPGIPGLSYVRKATTMVWETDPYELKLHNQKLLAGCGADPATTGKFFENPWLSPTWQTFTVSALALVEKVPGCALVVGQAAAAESETSALFAAQGAQLLAWYHQHRTPLARIVADRPAPSALTADGSFVVLAATDYVAWTEDLANAAQRIREQAAGLGAKRLEVGFLGAVSPRARQGLEKMGFKVQSDLGAESRRTLDEARQENAAAPKG